MPKVPGAAPAGVEFRLGSSVRHLRLLAPLARFEPWWKRNTTGLSPRVNFRIKGFLILVTTCRDQ